MSAWKRASWARSRASAASRCGQQRLALPAVEGEQQLAAADHLALRHMHLGDLAIDPGADGGHGFRGDDAVGDDLDRHRADADDLRRHRHATAAATCAGRGGRSLGRRLPGDQGPAK